MKINHNIKADMRSKGPMLSLFVDLSWTKDGKQSRSSIFLGPQYKVLREDWDQRRGMIFPKTPYSIPVRDRVIALMDFMLGLSCEDPAEFKEHVKRFVYIAPTEKPRPRSFRGFVELFISNNQGKYSPNTIRRYRTLIANIGKFGVDDTFPGMDQDQQNSWFSRYVSFLMEQKYSNPSIKQEFKLISSVRNAFTDTGILVDTSRFVDYLKDGNTNGSACTMEELQELMSIDTSAGTWDDLAVDLFVFMCLTGLRISEVKKLRIDNIRDGMITYTSEKTGTENKIPLCTRAEFIANKYAHDNEMVFPQFNMDIMSILRRRIKSIPCFDRMETKVRYSGANRLESSVKRYLVLTLHSARHTFSHIMAGGGMSLDEVGKLLNHGSTETTRRHYEHLSQDNMISKAKQILNNI